jgi:site-specific DNA-methyltransferase (adenine-specific)
VRKPTPASLEAFLDQFLVGDALRIVPNLPENSIDAVVTDPPYFLDRLDSSWNPEKIQRKAYKSQQVFHLPPGMKFDPQQGKAFYAWFLEVAQTLYRVLKPGGFFFAFSSPRLYHRLASAVDDAGFHIRDTFLWLYTQSQPKAMSLLHFLDKMMLPEEQKTTLRQKLAQWKTPQVKSTYEPILVAQKPSEGTLLENFLHYSVGLFNTAVRMGQNMFPSNTLLVEESETLLDKYFLIPKPRGQARGPQNGHYTVKPILLCQYLIELSTVEGAVVLDPFVGSGTTAMAAAQAKRHFIGIDINPDYITIAQRRLQEQPEKLF